jgi:type I restriction enzyme S subunit
MALLMHAAKKDSRISWLQEVPCSWGMKRLKFSVNLVNEKVGADSSELPYIGLEHIESWTGRRILGEICASDGLASEFLSQDVLFGKLRPYLAKVHLAQNSGLVSSEALVLRTKSELAPDFLKYYLLSPDFIRIVDSSTYGSKMPRASWDFIGNLPVLLPSIEEQRAIALFLDFKTAQIDSLIAKKKALLEKLAEKRTAVISHAVTKGLDSSVPIKDSGVEHFLFIPSDWRAIRVRHCIDFLTSGSRGWAEYFSPEGSRFLRITNLTRDSIRIDLSDLKFVLPPMGAEVERTAARPGDVVISITADLGCVAVIPECANNSYVSQHLALLRPINKIIQGHWLAYQVLAMSGKSQLLGAGYGGSKIQLSLDDIKDLWIALPPVEEQIKILEYIGRALQKIDEQTKKVSEAIVRLGEYRSALITNAVTGKIDVRGFQIPADAHAITECNV